MSPGYGTSSWKLNRTRKKFILAIMAAVLLLGYACGLPQDTATGIMGTVTIGPVNPVSRPGEPYNIPYPDASFSVRSLSNGKKLKVKSDKDGLFKVFVPEGRYVLESESGDIKLPFLKPVELEVVKGSFTEVDVNFDSGIR